MPSARPNPPLPRDVASTRPSPGALALLGALVLAIGVPVTWDLIDHEWRHQREAIEALATTRATQAQAWWDRHLADARLLASAYPLAESFVSWHEEGDAEAQDLLARRLTAFVADGDLAWLVLLDPDGRVAWGSRPEVDARGAAAAAAAVWPAGAPPGAFAVAPPTTDATGTVWLPFLTSLPTAPPAPAPVIVAAAPLSGLLDGSLAAWPVGMPRGRVALVHAASPVAWYEWRDDLGSAVAAVLTTRDGLAAVPTELSRHATTPVDGTAPDGTRVVAAMRRVGASDWVLIAAVDRASMRVTALPILATATVVAVLAFVVGASHLAADRRRRVIAAATLATAHRRERERSMALLGAVTAALPDPLFAKDLDGTYLMCNPATARVAGRPREEIVGRRDEDLFPPDQAAALRTADLRALASGRSTRGNQRLAMPSGDRVFDSIAGPLVDEEGRTFGTFGIARDVTELHEAERARERQAAALVRNVDELERFNRAMVGRELAMARLKREVNALAGRLGEQPPYPTEDEGPDRDG